MYPLPRDALLVLELVCSDASGSVRVLVLVMSPTRCSVCSTCVCGISY